MNYRQFHKPAKNSVDHSDFEVHVVLILFQGTETMSPAIFYCSQWYKNDKTAFIVVRMYGLPGADPGFCVGGRISARGVGTA